MHPTTVQCIQLSNASSASVQCTAIAFLYIQNAMMITFASQYGSVVEITPMMLTFNCIIQKAAGMK